MQVRRKCFLSNVQNETHVLNVIGFDICHQITCKCMFMRNIYVCVIHLNVRYFRNRMQYFLNNHFQIIFRTHTYLYLNLFGHLHIAHYLHIHMYKHVSHVTFTSTKSQTISKAISCCAPFHKHSYRASLESKQTCFNVLTVPASYFHTHTLAPNII